MINEVRNTVMFILNKENNGYISPEAFNDFARTAQLEATEELHEDYVKEMIKMNNRLSGTGYGDAPRHIKESIDRLMVTDTVLEYNVDHFELPSNIEENLYDPADYAGASSPKYDNSIDWDWYRIVYVEYNGDTEVDRIEQRDVVKLNNSKLMAPSTSFPVYTLKNNELKVFPTDINSGVTITYLRYPRDPKWTWTTLTDGEPVFDQGATDYQDFELPISEMPNLIVKICALAGVEIREPEVVQAMNNKEVYSKQIEQ